MCHYNALRVKRANTYQHQHQQIHIVDVDVDSFFEIIKSIQGLRVSVFRGMRDPQSFPAVILCSPDIHSKLKR